MGADLYRASRRVEVALLVLRESGGGAP